MNVLLPIRNVARKHKVLTVLVCIALVGLAFFAVRDWIEGPRDLGSKIEYVGKHQFSCFPDPFNFICIGGGQYYVYYFATDMSQEELQEYFTKATHVQNINDGGGTSASYSYSNVYFAQKDGNGKFSVTT